MHVEHRRCCRSANRRSGAAIDVRIALGIGQHNGVELLQRLQGVSGAGAVAA
jgi:hypothetical protein